MSYKQSTLRSRLYAFYEENKEKGKSFVWHHFRAEGAARATIYRLMGQIDKGLSLSRKKGSGRKPIFNTPKKRSQVARKFNHKKGVSLRKVAKSLNCSKSTIQNMLKMRKNPILCYKRTKRPDRTPIQRLVARPKCRHLYFKFREHQFIIDDESYFTLSNANLSGNDIFYSNNRNITANDVKYYDKAKYEPKLLVWVAISPAGISDFYIVPSKMAINQEIYLEECLKKRLLPFINKHHRGGKYVFWPDMASSHYANTVQNWLIKTIQSIP